MKQATFKKDLSGRTFGLLTVIGFDHCKSNGKSVWKTKCSCGNEKLVLGQLLINGHTKSCGKHRKKINFIGPKRFTKKWDEIKEIDQVKWYSIRYSAELRDLEFSVSPLFIANLFDKQGGLCALSGVPLVLHAKGKLITASLDRIDSREGYTENNVQWIHKDLQRVKTNMPEDIFLSWVDKIYQFKVKKV